MAKLVIEPNFFVLEADSHWLNLHLVQEEAKGRADAARASYLLTFVRFLDEPIQISKITQM